MKSSIKVLLFLILGLTSCGDDTIEFDSIIELREGESVVMPDKSMVTLIEINDFRCRTGTNCVWAGRAEVILNVTVSGTENEVALNDVEKAAVVFGNYNFEFIELRPFPSYNTSTSGTVLKIKVSLNQ